MLRETHDDEEIMQARDWDDECWGSRAERRDAAEHRRRILAVARALFAERGVDAVSMHQIARAAGVGQGTLYRRYADKGLLCIDLLGDSFVRLRDEILSYLDSDSAPASALDRLDGVLARIVAIIEENSMLLDAACEGSQGAGYHSPFYRWLHHMIGTLLERAAAAGECDDLDVPYAADAIMAAISPLLYRHQRRDLGFPPERIMQGLRRLYVDGLRALGGQSTRPR